MLSESEKLQAQLEPLPDPTGHRHGWILRHLFVGGWPEGYNPADDGPEIAIIEQVTRAEHDDRVARLKQKHVGFPRGD